MRLILAALALAGAMVACASAAAGADAVTQGADARDVMRARRCAPPFGCRRRKPAPAAPRVNYRSDMAHLVDQAAASAGVPVAIARAVIRHESGFNPRARSHAGAIGIGQILFSTARSLGYAGNARGLYDPHVNLRFSMRYLRLALDRGGSGCAGLSLYERGIYARPVCTTYGRQVVRLAMR